MDVFTARNLALSELFEALMARFKKETGLCGPVAVEGRVCTQLTDFVLTFCLLNIVNLAQMRQNDFLKPRLRFSVFASLFLHFYSLNTFVACASFLLAVLRARHCHSKIQTHIHLSFLINIRGRTIVALCFSMAAAITLKSNVVLFYDVLQIKEKSFLSLSTINFGKGVVSIFADWIDEWLGSSSWVLVNDN